MIICLFMPLHSAQLETVFYTCLPSQKSDISIVKILFSFLTVWVRPLLPLSRT